MRAILSLILIIILVVVVSLAAVLGFSLLIGWLLTLILPFTLFEGSLLALIATIAVGVIAVNFFKGMPLPDLNTDVSSEDSENFKEIPEERIFKAEQDRTLENQYRYEMANRVYGEFQENSSEFTTMNDKQQQELALRLADIALTILMQKSVTATRLNLTKAALKKQMQKMNQQPYSDDILDTALSGLNDYIFENFDDLSESIHTKDWQNQID